MGNIASVGRSLGEAVLLEALIDNALNRHVGTSTFLNISSLPSRTGREPTDCLNSLCPISQSFLLG